MGLGAWFTNLFGPKTGARAEPVDLEGLDVQGAVGAHLKWKTRLTSYVEGTSTEKLEVAVIARDDQCPLGKWIHGKGATIFGSAAPFRELKEVHAHFHWYASKTLFEAQAGNKAAAVKMLTSGDYDLTSQKIQRLLTALAGASRMAAARS